jgi:peptide/nickel transport system permease protein
MNKRLRTSPSINWVLWVGILLALAVGLMAVFGPGFAPADPMQESYIGQSGDRFIKPPFPPNTVDGYPLGSDEWGRDLLSRLLWAVRPTMLLVLVVAAVRLVVGITAGLVSGWSRSWVARLLDTLISACLTAPVFFVALCVIALVGSKWGVWAFILGLSLTGWAEAARLVREQTRALRTQTFVEASRAMGASSEAQLLSHILPHVLPMMWIQLSFEVAGTLLAAAALGFLGYYMNGIWIPVGDWIGQRATGMPELGEMLGSATTQRIPWSALFSGTVVVMIVLAFNIMGEGLRTQLSPDRQRRRADMTRASVRAGAWVEDRLYSGIEQIVRFGSANGMILVLTVVLIGGMWAIWNSQGKREANTVVSIPGGHWWATSKHDAQGTYWSSVEGPAQAALTWSYEGDQAFTGGPVVDEAGRLYLNNADGRLYALDAGGQLLWRKEVPGMPYGTPALAPDGKIIVVDEDCHLTAFSPEGDLLWTAGYVEKDVPTSSPVVAANGTTYFSTRFKVVAIYPSGKLRFLINLPTYSVIDPMPRLSMDGRYLFFEDTVVNAETGELDFDQTKPPMDSYVVGADGKNYIRAQAGMDEWQVIKNGYVLIKKTTFDERTLATSFRRPAESGVSPGGNVWVIFSAGFDIPRFAWFDTRRSSMQVVDFPTESARMIGIDQAGRLYMCSDPVKTTAFCRAMNVSNGAVEWDFPLPEGAGVTGGAIVPGRLYVSVGKYLYAIGN